MAGIDWTAEQRRAIEMVDRSVLVSAAAGSGKTAVLAARCAHLVCDAAPPFRCDVDRLLVVTFTEAAAAEMTLRIQRALAERSREQPDDHRLRRQMVLVDTAQISTLHAFCLWMVRRWFNRAGIDAVAQMLDEDEARLLRTETLDTLFNDLYNAQTPLGVSFRRLIEDYGLGYDRGIAAFTLQLAGFVTSLANPDEWLAEARDASSARIADILTEIRVALTDELERQIEHAAGIAAYITDNLSAGNFYGRKIADYAVQLEEWFDQLTSDTSDEGWNTVAAGIGDYEMSSRGAPRFNKDASENEKTERDRARDLFNDVRGKLLNGRLRRGACRFTAAELRDGVIRTAPYAATIADLVEAFLQRYDRNKRVLGVMDFSDLERLAYKLLTEMQPGETENPIAVELRERFVHVLVDEYQDINPLQAAILSLISRESLCDGAAGNLFTVGDVKQSIYRFRLAEPEMFLARERDFDDSATSGACIRLQANFRSTPAILDAVNLLFRRLMPPNAGDIVYNERAELRHPEPDAPTGQPTEIHVLERQISTDTEEDNIADQPREDRPRFVDLSDPAQWTALEREAFLIGRRIQDLVASAMPVGHGDEQHPLKHRDICILLRSTKHTAEPLANMLTQMGIPAWADVGAGLFDTLEIRDVLSLLAILDNLQQDIPLAAVLRSGLLGERLNEDELTALRVFARGVPFHEAVRAYAARGPAGELKERVNVILRHVANYRELVRMHPLADVLWRIYYETGYLAYVGGLRGGEQRRANLLALHERARQFGQFRRQGLRRFLAFIDSLKDDEQDLGAPSPLSESEDVVRIMSIHKSKGLEFPVVIAADTGRRFNLADSTGRMLYARDVGIGLKAVDRDRLIEWPTATHEWCARSSERASRDEELRVWYVAATRARQKLVSVGTSTLSSIDRYRAEGAMAGSAGKSSGLSPLAISAAQTPLQWLTTALGAMPDNVAAWNEPARQTDALRFHVTTYSQDVIRAWRLDKPTAGESAALLAAAANLDPLPPEEPLSDDRRKAETVIANLDYTYPQLALSSVRVAWAASEAKQRYADEAGTELDVRPHRLPLPVAGAAAPERDLAIRRGRATHTALEFLRRQDTGSTAEIAAAVDRLVAEGRLDAADAPLIDVDALLWFAGTDLGQRVMTAGNRYRREWMFLATEPAARFDPGAAVGADERVLVRGVVDGVLDTGEGLEVVDFKTDAIRAGQVRARAAEYQMQLELYASAASRIFGQPVVARHLVFLHPRDIVTIREEST